MHLISQTEVGKGRDITVMRMDFIQSIDYSQQCVLQFVIVSIQLFLYNIQVFLQFRMKKTKKKKRSLGFQYTVLKNSR